MLAILTWVRSFTRNLAVPGGCWSSGWNLAGSRSVTNTVWRVIFVESPKRPTKLIFVVLNFVTATSLGAWHCCISDDVINTRARDLCYLAIPTETWTNSMR